MQILFSTVVALAFSTASALSLRSLISSARESSAIVESEVAASSSFDISTCGKGKGCFLPNGCAPGANDNACNLAYSYRPLDDLTVEMELYATIETEITEQSFWVAVAFSDDQKMILFSTVVALAFSTASALSLRSLISSARESSAIVESEVAASSSFDISTCGKGKGCFLPNGCAPGANDNACNLAYSYRPLDDLTVEMELYATIETEITEQSFWVAVAFSDDQKMGDDPVTECSLYTSEKQPSIKASYNFYDDEQNKVAPNNKRIDDEETIRGSLFNTTTISTVDGVIYCKFTQKIGGLGDVNKEYLATNSDTPFYLLIAKGITNNNGIEEHKHKQRAVSGQIKFSETGSASSISLLLISLVTAGKMLL